LTFILHDELQFQQINTFLLPRSGKHLFLINLIQNLVAMTIHMLNSFTTI